MTNIASDNLISAKEAAARMGLSIMTIRRWISDGKITSAKFGRAVRIPMSEIDRVIEESKVQAKTN